MLTRPQAAQSLIAIRSQKRAGILAPAVQIAERRSQTDVLFRTSPDAASLTK
jgi:hypothetical protein